MDESQLGCLGGYGIASYLGLNLPLGDLDTTGREDWVWVAYTHHTRLFQVDWVAPHMAHQDGIDHPTRSGSVLPHNEDIQLS